VRQLRLLNNKDGGSQAIDFTPVFIFNTSQIPIKGSQKAWADKAQFQRLPLGKLSAKRFDYIYITSV
jgi:hypothetical protein